MARMLGFRITQRFFTQRSKFSSTTSKKKADPTGMDVGAWNWQWKAGGGVAVALFTPWACLKLLQINWETRENLEAVMPSLVQWVRENYGFEDEDESLRAHVKQMELMYQEPVVVYHKFNPSIRDNVVGISSVDNVLNEKIFNKNIDDLLFEDLKEEEAQSQFSCPEIDSSSKDENRLSKQEKDPLIGQLNQMRSLWDNESLNLASDLIGEAEVEKRQIIEAIVGATPVAPGSQSNKRSTDEKGQSNHLAMKSADIEKKLNQKLGALESELKSGLSGRTVDDIEEDISETKEHLRKVHKALRPWAFWV